MFKDYSLNPRKIVAYAFITKKKKTKEAPLCIA
jgi:hypothetical protein